MTGMSAFVEGNLVRHRHHRDWGIGSVEQIDGDCLTVRFYGREELLHACQGCELERHVYPAGEPVFVMTEKTYGIVQSNRCLGSMVTYQVIFGQRRKGIPETNIRPQIVVPDLFDTLAEGHTPPHTTFLLALQARRLHYAYRYDDLVCLSNARIELMPHQVFVADRVLGDYPHRFLLADEVGLGKTIEAGLILKELRARGIARRVLVIAPAGLVTQWIDELNSKFNENFTRIDSTTIQAHIALCGGNADHIWHTYPFIVTSLHLLRSHEHSIDAILAQEWNLVIFDEAHHLRRYLERRQRTRTDAEDQRTTAAYRLAQRLQQRTQSLLLLTATPLQLHSYELYSLIELLDPTLFPNFRDFEDYRATIPRLNHAAHRLMHYETLTEEARFALAQDIVAVTSTIPPSFRLHDLLAQLDTPDGRAAIQARLSDAHRLTRVLIRNRKRQVFDDLQPRIARMIRVDYTEAEWQAYHAVTAYLQEWYNIALQEQNNALGFLMVTYRKILTSSSYALRQSFLRRIERLRNLKRGNSLLARQDNGDLLQIDEAEEVDQLIKRYGDAVARSNPALITSEIEQLQQLEALLGAIHIDAKATGLLQELARMLHNPHEKVLIFTQFTETLAYLQNLLNPYYTICTFHGGMEATEKDQAVDDFRETCQIMIATEAAGEGRNLQFCHIMVNYDLPWNPMRIEQRIGRIDRIGQQHPVQIFNLVIANTLEERVLHVLHERINIFESVFGTLDPILESIEQDVRTLMFSSTSDIGQRVQAFEERVMQRMNEVRQMEERLADLLLDTSSFRRDRADALLGRTPTFSGDDIRLFLTRFLEHTGGHMQERSTGIYDITVPYVMRRTVHDGTREDLRDGYQVTFDPVIAQQRARLDFVAFGHPVLDRAVEICLNDTFGSRIAYLAITTQTLAPQRAIVAIYDFSFEGIRPCRQLRAFAAALTGDMLPEVSSRILALLAHAEPVVLHEAERQELAASLDACRDSIDTAANEVLHDELARHEGQNRREYERTYVKLTRYYEANRLSLTREIDRLTTLADTQEQSTNPNERRVAPATRGHVKSVLREREERDAEREYRLSALTRQRTVHTSLELLAIAYVTITSPQEKR